MESRQIGIRLHIRGYPTCAWGFGRVLRAAKGNVRLPHMRVGVWRFNKILREVGGVTPHARGGLAAFYFAVAMAAFALAGGGGLLILLWEILH
jgi:hypothetical protein